WLVALAMAQIAGALLELVLLAQDIPVPYTRLDFAMGLAQAAGASALWWGLTMNTRHAIEARVIVMLGLFALAALRGSWPTEAGWGICLAQAFAVLGLLRESPRRIPTAAGLLLTLAPVLATHGPWAYAINRGRRTTDWSH